jgi:hypothetical protein
MAGLDPAIYAFATHWIGAPDRLDHRVKPGDDAFKRGDQRRHNRFLQTGQQWVRPGNDEKREAFELDLK